MIELFEGIELDSKITICLSKIGYQIDIGDEGDENYTCICRDYGGDIDVQKAIRHIWKTVHELEDITPDTTPYVEEEDEEDEELPEGMVIPDVVEPYELDTIYEKVHGKHFDGKTLKHHMFGNRPLKFVNNRLFAEMEFSCEQSSKAYGNKCKSGITYKCYIGPGLHAGAWCYAYNLQTFAYEANLRDQVYTCPDCKAKQKS